MGEGVGRREGGGVGSELGLWVGALVLVVGTSVAVGPIVGSGAGIGLGPGVFAVGCGDEG